MSTENLIMDFVGMLFFCLGILFIFFPHQVRKIDGKMILFVSDPITYKIVVRIMGGLFILASILTLALLRN